MKLLLALLFLSNISLADADNSYTVEEFSKALQLDREALPEKSVIIDTALGRLSLFQATEIKGLNIRKIILQAFQISADILRKNNFEESLITKNFDWRIVVSKKINQNYSKIKNNYCHLAQMGPPADIVFDARSFSKPCIENLSLDLQILSSLIHEIAHVIEYHLLAKAYSRRERWHSEGFALWFQSAGIDLMKNKYLITYFGSKELEMEVRNLPEDNWSVYTFSGSRADYLRSYSIIKYIIAQGGITQLLSIYQEMSEKNLSFSEIVQQRFSKTVNQISILSRDKLELPE